MKKYPIRTLRHTNSVSCFTRYVHNETETIALCYGTRIELVDQDYNIITKLTSKRYVTEIASIRNNILLLIDSELNYVVLENLKEIKTGQLINSVNTKIKKIVATDNCVVIVYDNNRITNCFYDDGIVLFVDDVNFLWSYRIVDMVRKRNKFIVLLKDCENRIAYVEYEAIVAEKRSKLGNVVYLPIDTIKIHFFEDKIVAFSPGKIRLLKDSKILYELNFANPVINCCVKVKDGFLVGMGENEIAKIRITNCIFVETILKLKFEIQKIIRAFGLYFGCSRYGSVFFERKKHRLVKITERRSIFNAKNLMIGKGIEFTSERNICKINYKVALQEINTVEFESAIKNAWVYLNILVVSFTGYSFFYDIEEDRILKKQDEILNFKQCENGYYLCTKDYFSQVGTTDEIFRVESEEILQSDFYGDHILLFVTNEISLFYRDLRVAKKNIIYDVSLLVLHESIYVSNTRNEFIIMNYKLETIGKFYFDTFVSYGICRNYLFLITENFSVMKTDLKSIKIEVVFKSSPHREKIFVCDDEVVLFTGKDPCLIFSDGTSFYINENDINAFGLVNDDCIFYAKKNYINFCKKKFKPKFYTKIATKNKETSTVIPISNECGSTNLSLHSGIRDTEKLTSHLNIVKNDTILKTLEFEDKLLVFIEYISKGLALLGINYEADKLMSEVQLVKFGKKITVLSKKRDVGITKCIGRHKNKFVMNHGSKIVFYEIKSKKIIKKTETFCPVFPINFSFSRNGKKIKVSDIYGLVYTLWYKKEGRMRKNLERVEEFLCPTVSGYLKNFVYLTDENGMTQFIPKRKNNINSLSVHTGKVVNIIMASMGPGMKKRIYMLCEDGSVFVLYLSKSLPKLPTFVDDNIFSEFSNANFIAVDSFGELENENLKAFSRFY